MTKLNENESGHNENTTMGLNGFGVVGFIMLCIGIGWYLFTWYQFFPMVVMVIGFVFTILGVE